MATATKKTDDFTKNPKALTAEDVNGQDARTRLWQSLDYTYGQQRKASDEAYARAISQADNQALSRGMGRSSYNSQVLANLGQKQVEAQNDIYDAQIADYQNRIGQIEQQEAENERWERQFNEGVRQFNENQAFQREENAANRSWQSGENALSRAFQTSERVAQQGWQSSENALNRAFQTSEREAQQRYNTGEREAQQTWQSGENALNRAFTTSEREAQQRYNTSEREAQQGWQSSENALNRAFQTSERIGQQEWQAGQNALNREQSESQFARNLEYNLERAGVSDTQWEQEFAERKREFDATNDAKTASSSYSYGGGYYGGSSSSSSSSSKNTGTDDYSNLSATERKYYGEYAKELLASGQMPSDKLLAMAGLSQEDAVRLMTNIQEEAAQEAASTEKLSASDRKYYAGYVQQLLEAGGTVSDEMLAKAGLTREEAEFLYHPPVQQPVAQNYYYYQTPAQTTNNTSTNPGNVGTSTNKDSTAMSGLFGNVMTVPGVTGSANTAKTSAITLSPEQIKQAYNNAKANRAVK